MLKVFSVFCLIISMFFISSCNQKPDVNIPDVLSKSEKQIQKLDKVKTTASAFDGKSNIKFRLMVEGRPSKVEVEKLFNETLNTIAANSNNQDLWNYYNADFDIKSYQDGVVFEAAKPAGDSLKLTELIPGRKEN